MRSYQSRKFLINGKHPNIPDFPKTLVTWELEKIENNNSRLTLVHSGFQAGQMLKQHDEGWSYFLNELEMYSKQKG